MSRARDLSRLTSPTNFTPDGTTGRVGLGSENPTAKLNVAGIVSATAFYGDGSNLEGVASAGLGTAVDDTSEFGGQQIYFTDTVLGIAGTVTVNPPDSSNIAYTQYQEISVDTGADLIIGDGDDLITDILGISSDVQVPGILAGGGGRVRADNFSNKAGTGAPTFPTGINVSGAATVSGNLTVGGVLTYADVTNIDAIGIITARSDISIADKIIHTGDTNTSIRFPAADTFTVETAGSEALRVDSSGNVRIGSGGIVGALSVQAETDGNLHIRDISDVIGSGTGVALDVLNDASNSVADLALRGATTVFRNASGETLRIDSSGRLLLGTTTEGESNADDLTIATSGHTGITIRSGTANRGNIYFSDGTSGDSEYRGYVTYDHDGDKLKLGTTNADRLVIDNTGRFFFNESTSDLNHKYIFSGSESSNVAAFQYNNNTGTYLTIKPEDAGGVVELLASARSGANPALTFNTGGSESLRITSGGYIGIGEVAPGGKLTVKHANTSTSGLNATLKLKQGSATNGNRSSLIFSSLDDFDVAAVNGVIETHSGSTSGNEGRLEFWTKHSGSDIAVRGRFDSEGSFYNFSVNHGIYTESSVGAGTVKYLYRAANSSGSNIVFNVWSNGNVESATNSFGPVSDVKLKENIVDANSQWEDFKAVQFRKFNFKEESGYETHTQLGVIAQELESISPGLVYETPDLDRDGNEIGTTTKKVKASVLTMKALVALQEAIAKIETLEAAVAALQG